MDSLGGWLGEYWGDYTETVRVIWCQISNNPRRTVQSRDRLVNLLYTFHCTVRPSSQKIIMNIFLVGLSRHIDLYKFMLLICLIAPLLQAVISDIF